MQRYGVEHNLLLYAENFFLLDVQRIYDEQVAQIVRSNSQKFHVYLIGLLPKISIKNMRVCNGFFVMHVSLLGEERALIFDCPMNARLEWKPDGKIHLMLKDRELPMPSDLDVLRQISLKHSLCDFEVLYIGQSYGKNGSRDALDRLRNHEKLQEIAIKHENPETKLHVLLLQLQESYSFATVFSPNSLNPDKDEERIKNGISKIDSTTEAERITLFEASLISHLKPHYNKEFKHSFPSTDLKTLQDCYEKDFLFVTAEVSHEELPFRIFSKHVPAKWPLIAFHDLQNDESRKLFFFG